MGILHFNLMLGLSVLTFVFAFLSWKYVEIPFQNQSLFRRKKFVICIALFSLSLLAFGVGGKVTNGYAGRFNHQTLYPGDVQHLDFHKFISSNYVNCTPVNIKDHALIWEGYVRCMQSKTDDKVDIALVGDSHAEHLFIGLAESIPQKNIAFYIKSSPPFVSNNQFNEIFTHIDNSKSITTVIISMYWIERLSEISKKTTLELELSKTLQALVSSGKSVYIVDDVPYFPFAPERCKFEDKRFSRSICDTDIKPILDGEKKYQAQVLAAIKKASSVKFISLKNLFCDYEKCNMVHDGQLMYRDRNHLNILGSRYVGSQLVIQHPELRD